VPRDPALRPYRLAVYLSYGLVCAFVFVQLIRSVTGDLYGRPPRNEAQASATACLDDVERLYAELLARATQPAPGLGLEGNQLAREWDAWSRRWEDDLDRVSQRCRLDDPRDDASRSLAGALTSIEEIRRRLSRSGEDASEDARHVKESLAQARRLLQLR
jgi:hypothetical protein